MDEKPTNDPAKDKIDWREHHSNQPYAAGKYSYEDYVPAYRTAHAAYEKHGGKEFDDIEDEIAARLRTASRGLGATMGRGTTRCPHSVGQAVRRRQSA